jgi:glutamyl-tRNA reductase
MPNSAVSGSRYTQLSPTKQLPQARFAACSYIDATTHPLSELGHEFQQSVSMPDSGSLAEVILRTCHRLERYWAPQDGFGFESTSPHGPVITGHGPVSARLAQIAAGTRSLIIGERFVFQQVEAAFLNLPPDHLLLNAAAEALATAAEARRLFQLHADLDYSGLARMMLDGATSPTPSAVVVVGGGMLARAIAEELAASRAVVMVTRSPKRLRRHLADSGVRAAVSRVSGLEPELVGRTYDVVLATSGLEGDYRQRIVEISEAGRCRTVIDLCSAQTMDDRSAYLHLHHPTVLAAIEESNRGADERAVAARRWIDEQWGVCRDS